MFFYCVLAITCPSYSASGTSSATQYYSTCSFHVCGASAISISLCGCSDDTYIRLFDHNSNQLSYNDDAFNCGSNNLCSALTYYSSTYYSGDNTKCSQYYLHQGCFSLGVCSGTAVVTITSGSISCKHSPLVIN